MGYRFDSDIFAPYYYIKDKKTNLVVAPSLDVKWKRFESNFTNLDLLQRAMLKRKGIVAVMSHCEAKSRRDILIKNLTKFMDVSVYGKCGNLK